MVKVVGNKIYVVNKNLFNQSELSLLMTCGSKKTAKLIAETIKKPQIEEQQREF